MAEKDQVQWRGIRPTSPEEIFTRYEPPEGCTLVEAAVNIEANDLLIYTVPDGKTLYLTDLLVSIEGTAAGYGGCFVRNVADALQYWLCVMRILANDSKVFSHSFAIAKTVPEKYDVTLRSGAANIWTYGAITGYTRVD